MSIYKGNSLIAGGSQVLPLLTFIWSDCIKNHPSWLRADTFSWQSGSVYQAVYAHLVDDITGKTLQSETISGTTIQFYLADDGHKICPAGQESNVAAIYNATGVAWYYIIDTTNQRFKLPRTKYGFTGLRDSVGKYVEADTVQPRATQMYLYFYVGEFTQTALENTAGINAELFNEKVDLDSSWGFPSGTSTTITLGASGASYTATANGYFNFRGLGTAAGQFVYIGDPYYNGVAYQRCVTGNGDWIVATIPVKKGQSIIINYNTGANNTLYFIKADKTN